MADVVAFFGKNFTPNLITNKMYFSIKLIFCKNAIFEKSEKIHSHSPKYYANFRYIIKVRTRKLREIWVLKKYDSREITIFDRRCWTQLPLMLFYCLLFRERYYQKVMGSDYLLLYGLFILITYNNCYKFYDYIYIYGSFHIRLTVNVADLNQIIFFRFFINNK